MRTLGYSTLAMILLLAPSVIFAGDAPEIVVWFDGSGAFRNDSLVDYMNKLLTGSNKDPSILEVIKLKFPDATKLTEDQVDSIRKAINTKNTTAAFYGLTDTPSQGEESTFKTHFKAKLSNSKRSGLKLQGFGIDKHGGIQKYGGSSDNYIFLIPADPDLISQMIKSGMGNNNQIKVSIKAITEDKFWGEYTSKGTMDLIGKAVFENLVPGPYLVYVNQFDILTYLYRVVISKDQTVTLFLEKTLPLRFMDINDRKKNK